MEYLGAILIAGTVGGMIFILIHLVLGWHRRRQEMKILRHRLRM